MVGAIIMYTGDVSKTNQGGIAHRRREPKQVIQYANEVGVGGIGKYLITVYKIKILWYN